MTKQETKQLRLEALNNELKFEQEQLKINMDFYRKSVGQRKEKQLHLKAAQECELDIEAIEAQIVKVEGI